MNYTKPCGCKIYVDDSQIKVVELEYCPKHSASDAMYQALIWTAEWLGFRKANGEKANRADVVRIVKASFNESRG